MAKDKKSSPAYSDTVTAVDLTEWERAQLLVYALSQVRIYSKRCRENEFLHRKNTLVHWVNLSNKLGGPVK